jgi:hypothetical protein
MKERAAAIITLWWWARATEAVDPAVPLYTNIDQPPWLHNRGDGEPQLLARNGVDTASGERNAVNVDVVLSSMGRSGSTLLVRIARLLSQ